MEIKITDFVFEKMDSLWITSAQISDRGGSSRIEKKALFLGSLDVLNAFFCIKIFFVENFENPIFSYWIFTLHFIKLKLLLLRTWVIGKILWFTSINWIIMYFRCTTFYGVENYSFCFWKNGFTMNYECTNFRSWGVIQNRKKSAFFG